MKLLKDRKITLAALAALFSAILFALCVPAAKLLSFHVQSAMTGALLYLGAGIGLFFTMIFKKTKPELSLTKREFPYVIAMIALDISAVLFLMFGISKTTAANASLLGNFELVATSLAAFFLFKENISKKMFFAIILITFASIILSFEGFQSFIFNLGSIFVILSCVCWGFENNCTKMLSIKDTRQITMIKGIFSGLGGLIIAFSLGEILPSLKWIILTLTTGFVSYGVSVSFYIYAQRYLGASKTGAYYSTAPFFAVLFSLIALGDKPAYHFYIALFIMIIAAYLVISDAYNS